MRIFTTARVLALVLGAAPFVVSPRAEAQVSFQFHFGDDDFHRIDARHPLRGRQYQTMATLAHNLAETSQDLSEQTYRAARGDRARVKLLASISDFNRRAQDLHIRMDSYLDSPWEIRKDVDDLAKRARLVNQQVESARLFPMTRDLWTDAIETLDLMQQVLKGANVDVPAPRERGRGNRGWDSHRDADRNGNGIPDRQEAAAAQPPPPAPDSPNRGFDQGRGDRGATLSGPALQEFRRLAQELEGLVSRTRDAAGRGGNRDERVAMLDGFAEDVRRLKQGADSDRPDPRTLKQYVTLLLENARRASDSVRRGVGFGGGGNEWPRIQEILNRMAELT